MVKYIEFILYCIILLFIYSKCLLYIYVIIFLHCSFLNRLLLQVSTDAQVEEASVTIGCSLKSCRHLLEMAKELSVNVVGVT